MKKRGSKKAKQQSAWNKVKTKCSPWVKSRPKTTILLIVIGVGLLWYGLVVFADFVQFKSVEPRVSTLQNAIIEEAGIPTKNSKEGSCSYASAKFHKGDLSCNYGFSMKYSYSSHEDAQAKLKQFNEALDHKKGMRIIKTVDHSRQLVYESMGYGIAYDLHDWTPELDCSVQIRLTDDWQSTGRTTSGRPIYNKVIIISGGCSKGPMLRPIYPMKD